MPQRRRLLALRSVAAMAIVLALSCVARSHACDIPVFQYALENWASDAYEVIVFHRGPLSAPQREALGLLREGAQAADGNLRVTAVDLAAGPDEAMLRRFAEQSGAKLPWVAAYYPRVKRIAQPAWTGPLSSENARALLGSPLRRQIAADLMQRATASWVLLESGDRGKDNAAAALLERELARLEKTLKLPVVETWGGAPPPEPPPIKFTIHRLSREAAAEQMLVSMLLHTEDDLATKFAHEPLVFPIYGRGLVLYALAGPGINEWTIMQAAEFVTGPCSCEVKASNPGTDLLLALDWDAQVTQTAVETLPAPTGMAGFQDRAAEAERRLAESDAIRERERETAAEPSREREEATSVARPARTTASPDRDPAPAPAAAEASAPEPFGPPAPDGAASAEGAATAAPQTLTEPADVERALDQQALAAAATVDDTDDPSGVAQTVGALALIAALATAALALLRRRRQLAGDEEHERVTT